MKTSIARHKIRQIASREHNTYVLNGVNRHKPTSIVPSSFLWPFPNDLEQQLETRHTAIEKLLIKEIGKPFYSDKGFIIYQGDALEFLDKLDKSEFQVDLSLTSPPYNIGKEYENPMPVEDYLKWCHIWMNYIFDITKENGAFWLNVGYLEIPGKGLCVPIAYLLWDKTKFYMLQEIVWKYGAGVSTKRRLSPRNEKWLFYVKNPNYYTFNLDEIRDPNVKYPNQKKNGKYRCNPLGKNPSDVWEFAKVTTGAKRSSRERTGHPAQFPLGVVERIVRATSNQAEIVFDPFSGSGSSGIAAYGLGRLFIGFEIREDYCQMSVERFEALKKERRLGQSQLELF
jgi:adenine-specific DNA-methyltransferase